MKARKVSNQCVKNTFNGHFYLLLIGEGGKRLYVLIKDFNTFMKDHLLHCRRSIFHVTVYRLSVLQNY